MTARLFNRTVVAVAVSAVSLVGTSASTRARQNANQNQDQSQKEDQQQNKGQKARQQRLSQPEEQQRVSQQERRLTVYRDHLVQQQEPVQRRGVELQQQKRTAQVRVQLDYATRQRQQQSVVQSRRNYNYGRDPYFYTPSNLRYSRGGLSYETNQYGATLLRQAVNYGYQEGFRAGQADQQDRWASDYQGSYIYQDANYGYTGYYVDLDDYNHFFREGFRRGYEDGYTRHYRYGVYANGRPTMLGTVLSVILSLESIR
jgi:hypothetical protein